MYTVQWGCWLLTPLEWVAGLGMGTSTARGARFPVPNRSYPAEREPARSSPIHPIARLSGSERLRRSTAKFLLALLYLAMKLSAAGLLCLLPSWTRMWSNIDWPEWVSNVKPANIRSLLRMAIYWHCQYRILLEYYYILSRVGLEKIKSLQLLYNWTDLISISSTQQMELEMACCMMAPSHYLNQCWLFMHAPESNFIGSA